MKITPTRNGLRFTQHGVVISELRTTPGPTHSVFDVIAALIALLAPRGRVAVLGFAGGGMMAPLHALGVTVSLDCVDLDRESYEVFRRHCPAWAAGIRWHHAEATAWLHRQRAPFDLILDDLTVSEKGDIVKPTVSWTILPNRIPHHLRTGGFSFANLLLPPSGRWQPELGRLVAIHPSARIVNFDDFENRILIGGESLPSARALGGRLRESLRAIGSRQARRIQLEGMG